MSMLINAKMEVIRNQIIAFMTANDPREYIHIKRMYVRCGDVTVNTDIRLHLHTSKPIRTSFESFIQGLKSCIDETTKKKDWEYCYRWQDDMIDVRLHGGITMRGEVYSQHTSEIDEIHDNTLRHIDRLIGEIEQLKWIVFERVSRCVLVGSLMTPLIITLPIIMRMIFSEYLVQVVPNNILLTLGTIIVIFVLLAADAVICIKLCKSYVKNYFDRLNAVELFY